MKIVSCETSKRSRMSRWWRAYDEAIDDPKLIGLTDAQFRFWFNILCVCSAFGGGLPDIRTVSIKLRMQPRRVIRLLNDLVSAGLLDESNGLISPHNWQIRQYKSDVSTERVKRFRKRVGNVSRNVSETPPETETETETETEKKVRKVESAAVAAPQSEGIPDFLGRTKPKRGTRLAAEWWPSE
ncbi:MAG: hypothetical protein KGL35_27225, partial [Bradyrhizobium sp.]|nr:hypothetical protein [Bradyrhizobium sp.]